MLIFGNDVRCNMGKLNHAFSSPSPQNKCHWTLNQRLLSLVDEFYEQCLILVDIPIGLRQNGNLERLCDKEARKVLGNRKSSVFPVPCRNAVYQSTYQEASSINFQLTGKYISKQSWFISGRIRQVDERLGVIRKVYWECDKLVDDALREYKRSEINKDDILDALVAAVTAKIGFNSLRTIPAVPEHDEMGLRMEMVYYTPGDKILK